MSKKLEAHTLSLESGDNSILNKEYFGTITVSPFFKESLPDDITLHLTVLKSSFFLAILFLYLLPFLLLFLLKLSYPLMLQFPSNCLLSFQASLSFSLNNIRLSFCSAHHFTLERLKFFLYFSVFFILSK